VSLGARLAFASFAALHLACSTSPSAPQPAGDGSPGATIADEAGDATRAPEGGSGDASDAATDSGAACPANFAGCATFVSAGASPVLVYRNYEYDPPCLSVRAGTTVTFTGAPDAGGFLVHPLVQACGPAPALASGDAGTTASFVLTVPGIYGYYCLDHGSPAGASMSGAIEVVGE
jgi:plastocyanin